MARNDDPLVPVGAEVFFQIIRAIGVSAEAPAGEAFTTILKDYVSGEFVGKIIWQEPGGENLYLLPQSILNR